MQCQIDDKRKSITIYYSCTQIEQSNILQHVVIKQTCN